MVLLLSCDVFVGWMVERAFKNWKWEIEESDESEECP